jgi:hypothetical protein
MPKSIVVTVSHSLGAEAAQKRIAEGVEKLQREFVDKIARSEVVWTGNVADVRVVVLGQTTTAQIYVLSDALRIEVQLPSILAALSNKIQEKLTTTANDTLRLGPPKA